ncbi:MAG TPA: hypothetical protein VHT03_01835 [Rhizomicrobium sp.]|jgi:hypothetical protein|nr:hypothetical protein [Rhizomicrobium sp.]
MTKDSMDLTLPERVTRYREEAANARRFASQSTVSADRDSYSDIARRWDVLADDLEKQLELAAPAEAPLQDAESFAAPAEQ